ncbi:MAG: SLC13 family permease [Hahellaceae bacterium]|nr:SLC13 family permease [Hahellaceae bacterium]
MSFEAIWEARELVFVFGLLLVTIVLFVIDKIKMDMVALLVVLALALSGIISPNEAVSGFGASIVITIAALFVVGEGLYRTGVAAIVGSWILKVGGTSETRLLLLLMPAVALLSAFMSSTGAVALFIPVVLSIARKSGMSVSRLMMPLAFAALIGGMLTLIGTPPNIVASGILASAGHQPFGFFEFTPIGGVILIAGIAYLIVAVKKLLPEGELRDPDNPHPHLDDFAEKYGVENLLHRLQVVEDSPLIGCTVVDVGMRTAYEVTVFGIRRRGQVIKSLMPVLAETVFHKGDEIFVYATSDNLHRLCQDLRLLSHPITNADIRRVQEEFGFAEVMLRPGSALIGQTIRDGRFRQKFNLSIIGVRRNNSPLEAGFNSEPLMYGDTLLLAGGWRFIQELENKRDFVVLETPAEMEEVASRSEGAPMALFILLAMIVTMVAGWLPGLTAILFAAIAMVATKCVTLAEAYASLNSRSLVLIAGMLPLAAAMEKTGALTLITDNLVAMLGGSTPLIMCASLFILTSLFSQVISNTATTVLIAPIALSTATLLQVNPEPMMMAVAIAASTAFATPIASPVNTLVVAAGNYKFMDFVKVGVPLQIISLILTLIMLPLLFPF